MAGSDWLTLVAAAGAAGGVLLLAIIFDLFRSSAFLRRSDAQPEEKFVYRAIPRSVLMDCPALLMRD